MLRSVLDPVGKAVARGSGSPWLEPDRPCETGESCNRNHSQNGIVRRGSCLLHLYPFQGDRGDGKGRNRISEQRQARSSAQRGASKSRAEESRSLGGRAQEIAYGNLFLNPGFDSGNAGPWIVDDGVATGTSGALNFWRVRTAFLTLFHRLARIFPKAVVPALHVWLPISTPPIRREIGFFKICQRMPDRPTRSVSGSTPAACFPLSAGIF